MNKKDLRILKLGELIKVNGIAVHKSQTADIITWEPEYMLSRRAYYCGYTYRYEGKYIPGKYGSEPYVAEGYTQPRLDISRSVLLIRFKYNERENEKLTFPFMVKCPSSKTHPELTTINKRKRMIWLPMKGGSK